MNNPFTNAEEEQDARIDQIGAAVTAIASDVDEMDIVEAAEIIDNYQAFEE